MINIVVAANIILVFTRGICIALNCNIEFMRHEKTDASFLSLTKVNIDIMEKKEFKVGDVFQCGLVKLKCVESVPYNCDGCFLSDCCESDIQCVNIVGLCGSFKREDKSDVIFVKLED